MFHLIFLRFLLLIILRFSILFAENISETYDDYEFSEDSNNIFTPGFDDNITFDDEYLSDPESPLLRQTPMFSPNLEPENENDLVTLNNAFGASLGQLVFKQMEKNFIFSPVLLTTNLLLLQSGAAGQSRNEINNVLNLKDSSDSVKKDAKLFLSKVTRKQILKLGNRLFIQKGFEINKKFKKSAKKNYKTSVQLIDFSNKIKSAKTISKWMKKFLSKQSKQSKKIINLNKLNNKSNMLSVSALKMQSKWIVPFAPSETKIQNFATDNSSVDVETMNYYGQSLSYGESEALKAKFLKLPFKDGDMVVVLPNNQKDLNELENKIQDVLDFDNFQEKVLDVSLPKFKIRVKSDFKTAFEDLGIKDIFDEKKVDFSNIAGKKGDLVCMRFVQKVNFKISEAGLGAVSIKSTGLESKMMVSNKDNFYVTHPFLFFVKISNTVVILGKIVNPSL